MRKAAIPNPEAGSGAERTVCAPAAVLPAALRGGAMRPEDLAWFLALAERGN